VGVHVLTTGRAEGAIRVWGTLRPRQEAAFLADLSGRVDAVHVSLGDAVAKGQVLIEIDPELYLALVEEAESKLQSATLSQEKALKDFERSDAMLAKGTISDSEHEAARTRLAQAQAARAEAAATLARARSNLAEARLRAPFAGEVGSRPPDVGSSVTLGMPLVTLVDIGAVRAEALVSEQDLSRIHLGDVAAIMVEARPGETFTGTVTAIGPQTDAETKQFPVEIDVPNPKGHPLRGGMVARVRIVYEAYDAVPLLPVDALIEAEDGAATFFIVDGGIAHRRILTAGPRQGQKVAVLGGAAPGDTAVVLGQHRLREGTPVSVEEVH
jgi:membrane fusion protein (multidrug efflux system)